MKLRALGQEGSVVGVDEEAPTGQGMVCTAPGSGRAWHEMRCSEAHLKLASWMDMWQAAPRFRGSFISPSAVSVQRLRHFPASQFHGALCLITVSGEELTIYKVVHPVEWLVLLGLKRNTPGNLAVPLCCTFKHPCHPGTSVSLTSS